MCGILGLYTKTPRYSNRKFIGDALYAGTLRGSHGTGLVGVTDKGIAHTFKKAVAGCDALEMKGMETMLSNSGLFKAMIGHNRWKTQGLVSNANTHPFNHGHITLVHNGSVDSYLLPGNQAVDSDAIAHAMSVMKVEEVVSLLSGAFTLVWWDEKEDAMFVIRNNERPIWLAKDKDHDTVYFASERGMLLWLTGRNGISVDTPYQPEPGELLMYKDGNCVPVTRKLALYVPKHIARTTHIPFHDPLREHKLHIGQEVVISPIGWIPHNTMQPVAANTYGEMHFASGDHDILFASSTCRYLELDTSKEFSAKVCGSSTVNGVSMVRVGSLKTLASENIWGIGDKEVYVQYSKQAPLKEVPKTASNDSEEEEEKFLKGPGNKPVTFKEYTGLIRGGCCMCGDPLNIDDAPHKFDSYGNVYCESCDDTVAYNTSWVQH